MAGIHFDQQLALLHRLGVVGMQRQHGGVFLGGDGHHIAADIGVVGAFEVAVVKKPVDAPDKGGRQNRRAQNDEPETALAVACLLHGLEVMANVLLGNLDRGIGFGGNGRRGLEPTADGEQKG